MPSLVTGMKDKATILFVVNDPRFFVTHRLALAKGVREAGYDVRVAAPLRYYESAVHTIRGAGFILYNVPIDRQGLNPLRDVAAFFSLVRLYQRVRPDLVHHVTVKPILYGSLAARMTNVPAVVNAVSGMGRLFATNSLASRARASLMRWIYKASLSRSNIRTIFQNEEDRSTFLRAGIVREDTSDIINGSGTELHLFNPHGEPDTPPIVLMPARLLRQKGVREFVDAARQIKSEGINARFAVVGDAAGNRDALSPRELESIRDEAIVELWGWSEDIPAAMRRASIICLPSYHEGLPKALIDACAAARAIVATDVPGCRAVVSPGLNGLLVPPRNAQALAVAIRDLLLDRERRARMGAEGRSIAVERFGIAAIIQGTLRVYNQFTQNNPSIGQRSSAALGEVPPR
jgi:glycosyltransferase involved in cell wall biosynthesis